MSYLALLCCRVTCLERKANFRDVLLLVLGKEFGLAIILLILNAWRVVKPTVTIW